MEAVLAPLMDAILGASAATASLREQSLDAAADRHSEQEAVAAAAEVVAAAAAAASASAAAAAAAQLTALQALTASLAPMGAAFAQVSAEMGALSSSMQSLIAAQPVAPALAPTDAFIASMHSLVKVSMGDGSGPRATLDTTPSAPPRPPSITSRLPFPDKFGGEPFEDVLDSLFLIESYLVGTRVPHDEWHVHATNLLIA